MGPGLVTGASDDDQTSTRAMGPGLVTGACDDDPSGIDTYAQAGAKDGLSFLWAVLLIFPFMAAA